MEDHAIGTIHLLVRLLVRHSRPVHTYVEAVAEHQELLARELGAVVGDNRVRDPEPEDDVGEELDCLLGFDLADGSSLDPLENLSIATSKWVKPPGAFFSGPTRSSPHTANGHVMGIVCRAWAGRFLFRA